jgi:glutamate synthase (NADPH/NADH) large chain
MSDQEIRAAESALSRQIERRRRLIEASAYDPAFEHDACGVGLVAAVDGKPRREVVELALAALKAVWHRGAVDADGKTGDGAGIRIDVPQDFFRDQVSRTGHTPGLAPVCVGMIFLPRTDLTAQERARTIVEAEILRAGFYIYGWRQPPVRPDVIGAKANAGRPEIEQILFVDQKGRTPPELEKTLYVARRRIEKRAIDQGVPSFYVCSLSPKTLVYKGMFLAEQTEAFYPDLMDAAFVSSAAIFHQRYSTNTFPEWRLAQPFRMIAHNGEINTLKGNVNWMTSHEIGLANDAFGAEAEHVRPIIQPGSSDSAALDQAFEALVRGGRDAPLAKAILIPQARDGGDADIKDEWRSFFAYANAVMEPWDGPAAIAACDGRWAIAGMDRNGLRPLRWALSEDGILAVGSEAGMCPLAEERIARRGAVEPGRMIGVDLEAGRFYDAGEILDEICARNTYAKWSKAVRDIEPDIGPGPEERIYSDADLRRRLRAGGATREDLEMVLAPMIDTAKEAVGSMGDDTPLAVLSEQYRPLAHYFRQNFSQVTNPPIDPLREARVMSLNTRFRNLGAIRAKDGPLDEIYMLDSPILTNGMYARLAEFVADGLVRMDCTFARPENPGSGEALRQAIESLRTGAEQAVRGGAAHLVLTDEAQGPDRLPIPMILAVAGVHRRLLETGLRARCALTVRVAECFDSHACAVLIGAGATCVNPYILFEAMHDRCARGLQQGVHPLEGSRRLKDALDGGLLKIISKMGIAVISSYRGGANFEALGLSRTLVEEFFPGMPSRISGIGTPGLEMKVAELNAEAWGEDGVLPVGGFYKWRAKGETHALESRAIAALHKAVRNRDPVAYRAYVEALGERAPVELRDLFQMQPMGAPVALTAVENASRIYRRFNTPGMSLGALSPEAHGTLNIAMNRLGARSVSGEGGEDPDRYRPQPNGDNANSAVKQVASGRFGVTAEYLNECRELEIKIAQGAKPGEGGQLPGHKVTEMIARFRHATPGVMLISPPPHHDIYSIEDLAQLIYDLKQINPVARVTVKLVSQAGVGTVAAGVAKAKADVVLISGHVGGTGASPLTSIKYAGSPWEIGVSEAHQILSLNGLRDQVRLRTDGGLRSGRDIVMAAMLGAGEFGIGTISLVAMGCLMVRQCHSNTCPVGVTTQDEALRKRFTGEPEHVVNLMTFLAEEVREILARLGARSLEDVIGRTDLLVQVSRGASHLDDLDLNPLLVRVDPSWRSKPPREGRVEPSPSLDETEIVRDAAPALERKEKVRLAYTVQNTHRSIGARLSSHIVRKHGADGLPDGMITVTLRGSAGQSFGAFLARGVRLELEGEANDYVGKGLSGGTIVVARRRRSGRTLDEAIIGNTCLYGATSGSLFAAGRAGERFAVRNSGATAVVEGVSANGCEYMTGGVVIVLGRVGANFAAGMTGGEAFLYDPHGKLAQALNPESVLVGGFADLEAEQRCGDLIEQHAAATGSAIARKLLDNWAVERARFRHVMPKDVAKPKGVVLKGVA